MPIVTGTEAPLSSSTRTDSIDIPGLLDIDVEEYTDWQQSQISGKICRDNNKKAHDVVLENSLGLNQMCEDQAQTSLSNRA